MNDAFFTVTYRRVNVEKTPEKVSGKTPEKMLEESSGKAGGKLEKRRSNAGETPEKISEKTPKINRRNVGETPEKILKQLRRNPKSTLAEVALIIGKSSSAVERATSKLVKMNRLRRVGADNGGYWEVLGE